MSTWRKHKFEIGKRYRVLKDIRTATDVFSAGEIVEFSEANYSRYDGSTAFRFESESDPQGKSWFLRDDDPDTSDQLFTLAK